MGNLTSLLVLLLAAVAAYFLRFETLRLGDAYLTALLVGLLLCSVILPATGAYRDEFRLDLFRKLRRLVAGWALVIMILVALAAVLKVTATYSRIWFGTWTLLGLAGLAVMTVAQYALLRFGRFARDRRRKTVLVGSGDAARRVESRVADRNDAQLRIVARFGEDWGPGAVRPIAELREYVAGNEVDDVWIAAELPDRPLLEAALEALKYSVVDVHVVPDLHQYRLLNQQITEWHGLPVISLSGTPMTGAEWQLKAVMDRLGAAGLIVVCAPLFALIWLAVRLSNPGPVLFRQLRHGIGGEPIRVLKFRTMKEHFEPEGQMTQARPGDERVTRLGRLLRRTSLDELPQLFNVLKGEMSLVGPRPHAVEMNDYYLERIPRYMLRHKARPGITGWAQINGLRGLTDTEDKMSLRIEHDLWYIQNWSLWLDLRILLRTPLAMIGRNAF